MLWMLSRRRAEGGREEEKIEEKLYYSFQAMDAWSSARCTVLTVEADRIKRSTDTRKEKDFRPFDFVGFFLPVVFQASFWRGLGLDVQRCRNWVFFG